MTKIDEINPVDAYIFQFPAAVKMILQESRQVIKEVAPRAKGKY